MKNAMANTLYAVLSWLKEEILKTKAWKLSLFCDVNVKLKLRLKNLWHRQSVYPAVQADPMSSDAVRGPACDL
jgi:hypothetical protein